MSRARTLAALAAAALATVARADGPKPIQDNSFLVEEAYNQEPGVVHHISLFTRDRATGNWLYSFTEEWPVTGLTHQASVTLQGLRTDVAGTRATGLGDVLLNYRWQAVGSGDAPVAVAPRATIVLPSGDATRGLGAGGAGLQVNLPVSATLGDRFVGHFNLGGTWIPSARSFAGDGPSVAVNLAQGLIWLARRDVNLMLEAIYTTTELHAPARVARTETFFVSPGIRGAIELPRGLEVVLGVGVPLGVGPSAGSRAVLGYLSFEHPLLGDAR